MLMGCFRAARPGRASARVDKEGPADLIGRVDRVVPADREFPVKAVRMIMYRKKFSKRGE